MQLSQRIARLEAATSRQPEIAADSTPSATFDNDDFASRIHAIMSRHVRPLIDTPADEVRARVAKWMHGLNDYTNTFTPAELGAAIDRTTQKVLGEERPVRA